MTSTDNQQFNQDSLSVQEKLNLETSLIQWKELQIFFARGKLIIVSNSQDLIEVATFIAENDADKLSKLIEAKNVQFATVDWIKENAKDSTELWAVVISPYVVAQLKVE